MSQLRGRAVLQGDASVTTDDALSALPASEPIPSELASPPPPIGDASAAEANAPSTEHELARSERAHRDPDKPPVRGVILTSLAALPLATMGGGLAMLIAKIVLVVAGDSTGILEHPLGWLAAFAGSELTFLLLSVCAGSSAPEGLRRRLCLVAPNVPRATIVSLMLGTLFVWFLGLLFYRVIQADSWLSPVDSSYAKLARMLAEAAWPWKIAFVLVGSVGAGVGEEFLFRGYLQTRLLQRWSVRTSILVSGAMFALAHFDPHHILGILPLCFWLGYIAARTGSIVPGILCHAFVNAVGQTSLATGLISGTNLWLPSLALGLIGLVPFVLGVRKLERITTQRCVARPV
jgi:membrane protease YdiL (CAAX protease family)